MSTMSNVDFRLAEHKDLAVIVRMLADDPLGATREDMPCSVDDQPAKAYRDAFADIQGDARNELIVAELNGEVVGCLQLTYIPGLSRRGAERAQIESVRVRRDQRGCGLGQTLFQWAIDRAREKNCALVQLTTDAERTDAHAFYQRLGFTPSHTGMKLTF